MALNCLLRVHAHPYLEIYYFLYTTGPELSITNPSVGELSPARNVHRIIHSKRPSDVCTEPFFIILIHSFIQTDVSLSPFIVHTF